jgi:broad specificity phosphatase PhoE
MRTIILARHGEGMGGLNKLVQSKEDLLTEKGIRQAKELAGYLKGKGINHIMASPSFRTLQTATIAAAEFEIPVSAVNELIEIDFGSMTGKPAGDLTIEQAMEMGKGETPDQVFHRVKLGWQKILKEKWQGILLVVTHRSILSAIDTILKGGTVEDFLSARKGNNELSFGYWKEIIIED